MKEVKVLVNDKTNVLVITAIASKRKATYVCTDTFDLKECDNVCRMPRFLDEEDKQK